MIMIIRMLTEGDAKKIWSTIISRKDSLQAALGKKGQLLYLTKRIGFNEASLFIHTNDINNVTELVTDHLNKIEGVSAININHLYKPRFFPVPKDTYAMKRFEINMEVVPEHFKAVYKKLLNPNLPDGLRKIYYAYTFSDHHGSLQYSLLSEDEISVQKFVAEHINTMEGILKTETHQAEKSKPFISYKEWLEYTSEGNNVPAWHHYMENHFAFAENE